VEELSYRFRTATDEDSAIVRQVAQSTLSHADGKGRREGYRAAVQRGELLLLERYDSRLKDWRIAGFVDWHMRVDDVMTIRDAGTEGERPHTGMLKQLFNELIRSLSPVAVSLKIRVDATEWNELIGSIPGFVLEGSEYRRPRWINVWEWSRERAVQATRTVRSPRFQR
jgi:hypothetical protein